MGVVRAAVSRAQIRSRIEETATPESRDIPGKLGRRPGWASRESRASKGAILRWLQLNQYERLELNQYETNSAGVGRDVVEEDSIDKEDLRGW